MYIKIKNITGNLFWSGNKWIKDEIWIDASGTLSWYYSTSLISWNTGCNYVVYAKAVNAEGVEQNNPSVASFYFDNVPPSKVKGLEGLTKNSRVELSWNSATDQGSGVVIYHVYRNDVLIANVSGEITTYVDSGLASGKSYIYKVSAVDYAENEGEKSNPLYITITGGEAGGSEASSTLPQEDNIPPSSPYPISILSPVFASALNTAIFAKVPEIGLKSAKSH